MTPAMATSAQRGRCVTGIDGLDNILGGGIPTSNIVLVTGPSGTGKTTLAMEFLARGAVHGEIGIMVTTQEGQEKLLSNIPRLDFLKEAMFKKGTITILELAEVLRSAGVSPTQMDEAAVDKLVGALGKVVSTAKVTRLVIDTVDTILTDVKDETLDAILLTRLSEVLYKEGCTAMLISSRGTSGTLAAISDGIVLLGNLDRKGDLLRTMQVVKMKGTSHSRARYVIDLTSYGVLVTPLLKGGS